MLQVLALVAPPFPQSAVLREKGEAAPPLRGTIPV